MTDTLQRPATLTHAGTYVDLAFPAFGNAIGVEHGYALYGTLAKLVPWLHGEEARAERVGVFPVRGTPGGDRTLLLGPGSAVRLRVPAVRVPTLLPLAGRTLTLDGCRVDLGVPRVEALRPAACLVSPLVLIKLAVARPQGGGRAAGEFQTTAEFQTSGSEPPTGGGRPATGDRPAADDRRAGTDRAGDANARAGNARVGDARAGDGRVDDARANDAVPPDAFLAAARRQLDALFVGGDVGLLTHADGPRAGEPRRRVIRVKTQTHVGYATLVQQLTAEESVRLQEHGLGGRRAMGCGLFLPVGDAA